MKSALVAVLFLVGCGDAAIPPSTVVTLSGVGQKTATVQLEAGNYTIAWNEPDSEWEAYCEKDKQSLPISIWVSKSLAGDSDPRTGQMEQNTQGGGTYSCKITAKAGSAWTITFTPG